MSNGHESIFPDSPDQIQFNVRTYGLTKREYFAAMAMQGVCANPDLSIYFSELKVPTDEVRLLYAESAVKIADALLLELSKPKP